MTLTFKKEGHTLIPQFGDESIPSVYVHRHRVDKELKQKYALAIAEFTNWVMAMYPVMRTALTLEMRHNMNNDIKAVLDKNPELRMAYGYNNVWQPMFNSAYHSLTRDILCDPQHPLRYAFGIAAMFAIDLPVDRLTQSRLKHKLNSWINEMCGFYKTVTVEMQVGR
jgi:hypothetical protein